MKRHFLDSIKLLNANIIFVFLIALIGIIIFGNFILLPFLNFILMLIIIPGVYAYFTEIIKFGKNEVPFFQNARKHFSNYLIVTILISIPIFLFILFRNNLGWKEKIIFETILAATINSLAIYIIPIVFIQQVSREAIPSGLKFLFNNFKYSLPLFLLVFVSNSAKVLIKIPIVFVSKGNITIVFLLAYLSNLIFTYITILTFLVASMILIKDSSLAPD